MSDSRSTDHWKELADQIGAAVPDEPASPEPAPESDAVGDEPSCTAEADADQPAAAEVEPQQSCDSGPADLSQAADHRPTLSVNKPPRRRSSPNHWMQLAAELGIAVPEAEPEPEPEPELQETAVDESDREKFEVPSPPPGDEAPEAVETFDREGIDAVAESRVEEEASDLPPFEDPDFLVETPGVLDAVFDEADAAHAACDVEVEEDELVEPIEEAIEEASVAAVEFGDELDEAAGVETVEQEEAAESEGDEKRSKRKRRRRRKRPRKDRAEAGDEPAEVAEESSPEEETASTPTPQSGAGVADEDREVEATKVKHRKIPTWEEAISVVISANIEARAKTSGGSRGKGRGRGRR